MDDLGVPQFMETHNWSVLMWIVFGPSVSAPAEVKRDTSQCPRLTKFQTTHVSLLKLWDADAAVQIWEAWRIDFWGSALVQGAYWVSNMPVHGFHSYSEAVQLIVLFKIQHSAPKKTWGTARHTTH